MRSWPARRLPSSSTAWMPRKAARAFARRWSAATPLRPIRAERFSLAEDGVPEPQETVGRRQARAAAPAGNAAGPGIAILPVGRHARGDAVGPFALGRDAIARHDPFSL